MYSPFALLCAAGFLALFSSTISKNPSLPLLVDHLGGSEATIGLVAAASAFSGILFSLPAGLLSDRLGQKRLLIVAGGVFATAPFMYLVASDIWQLGCVRFYHGLATAIFGPVAMAMVADLYQESKGSRLGWFSTATLLGRFLAPASGGIILTVAATAGGLSFTWLYLLCGLSGVLALIAIITLPSTQTVLVNTKQESWSDQWRRSLRTLKANRIIMSTCAVDAALLFCYGIFETFLPLLVIAKGMAVWQAGFCISSQVITIAATKPLLGQLSDRKGRPPQILAGIGLAVICMIFLGTANTFWQLLIVSTLLGLSISVVTSASAAHIADQAERGGYGSAMGALGSIMDMGHTAGPIAGGFMALAFGLEAAFVYSSGILIAGGGWFLLQGMVSTRSP